MTAVENGWYGLRSVEVDECHSLLWGPYMKSPVHAVRYLEIAIV